MMYAGIVDYKDSEDSGGGGEGQGAKTGMSRSPGPLKNLQEALLYGGILRILGL